MPLPFDVPGWSVAAAPVFAAAPSASKKRKRPADDRDSPEPHVDLQKFVKKHRDAAGDDASMASRGTSRVKELGKSLVKKTMERKRQKKVDKLDEKKKSISLPKPLKPSEKGQQMLAASASASSSSSSLAPPPAKRPKRIHIEEPEDKPLPTIPEEPPVAGLTALQKGMKRSLDGARFRLINELLYKTDSQAAHEMVRKDPKVFQDYHTGFRHQVQSWPTNPVQHYISVLSKYPARTVVADLGCGDAAMARALIPKGLNVLSFDLVSDDAFVIEADICGKLPLPGSEPAEGEKSDGEAQVVDVVVCALSLMGTNWMNCTREAWRILKRDGELRIAEVASRFSDVDQFSKAISSIGFKLKSKDDSNSHFTLFEFRKVSRKGKSSKEWAAIMAKGSVLEPCEYKRR